MWLHSLKFNRYKCFLGEEEVGPFGKANVFIGKNNSGKSHLVRAIRSFPDYAKKQKAKTFTKQDYYYENKDLDISLEYLWRMNADFVRELEKEGKYEPGKNLSVFEAIEKLTGGEDSGVFKICRITKAGWEPQIVESEAVTIKFLNEQRKPELDGSAHFSNEECKAAVNFVDGYLRDVFIKNFFDLPDLRRIEQGAISDRREFVFTPEGKNLIRALYDLERPMFRDDNKELKRSKFRIIKGFLRELMDDPDIEIQPNPLDDDPKGGEILVESKKGKGYIREISELGYGITELVLFATGISHLYRGVIVLEEPENHLHPETIKKLLGFITRPEDKNQYFIATHSNALLDFSPEVKVFRVEHNGEFSMVSPVDNYDKAFWTLFDMGYTPSDILQSNFVIWVEGPSDRIYIKRWLELFYEEHKSELFEDETVLKEGLHYSFASTGGSCLKHYTLVIEDSAETEQRIETFLNVVNLGRNCAVVLDSDKKNSKDNKNGTKRRIEKGVRMAKRLCWVTQGRTIENYISKRAYKAVFPNARRTRFSKPKEPRVRNAERIINEMDYNSEFVNNSVHLKGYIKELLKRIGKANNFPEKKDENQVPDNGDHI